MNKYFIPILLLLISVQLSSQGIEQLSVANPVGRYYPLYTFEGSTWPDIIFDTVSTSASIRYKSGEEVSAIVWISPDSPHITVLDEASGFIIGFDFVSPDSLVLTVNTYGHVFDMESMEGKYSRDSNMVYIKHTPPEDAYVQGRYTAYRRNTTFDSITFLSRVEASVNFLGNPIDALYVIKDGYLYLRVGNEQYSRLFLIVGCSLISCDSKEPGHIYISKEVYNLHRLAPQ